MPSYQHILNALFIRAGFGLCTLTLAAGGCGHDVDCNAISCPASDHDIPVQVDGTTCICKAAIRPPGSSGAAGANAPDPYACGSSSCDANVQTCEHIVGGAPPGVDSFSCAAIPDACTADVSCACVQRAWLGRGANQCEGSGRHLTIRIDVP